MLQFMYDSTSSSSSGSDSEEEMIINYDDDDNAVVRNRNRRPRVQYFIETVIYRYSAKEFQENFRLTRTTFDYLLFLLRPHLEGAICGFGKMPIPPEKQLYIALYVLGTPDSYRSVITKFDVGKATAWRAVKRVVKILCELKDVFIRWPREHEVIETCNRIERRYLFPGVLGAVDGTHIRIAAPKRDSRSYVNRKGVHSIQLQVICNEKLKFLHCFVGLPGSVHDMRVFKYSGIQQRCNEEFFPQDSHLLGDSAYAIQKHVMVPYRDNGHLTVEQTYYNKIHSSARMMVERSIGLLKVRWRYLLDKLPMRRTDLIPFYILSCCVLHNICLHMQDEFEFPVIIPDNMEYPEPLNINNLLLQQGIDKINRIERYISQDVN